MNRQPMEKREDPEILIKRYADMVYRLAFARTGSRYDADEIFQEVFLRYLKKRPVFESKEHAKAWFLRVTVNCSNTFLSSVWQKRTEGLYTELPFEDKETRELFEELQKLPPKYREVIHLFYYEDLSVEEIASALHRKSATVRTQLTRARAMLKNILEEEAYEF